MQDWTWRLNGVTMIISLVASLLLLSLNSPRSLHVDFSKNWRGICDILRSSAFTYTFYYKYLCMEGHQSWQIFARRLWATWDIIVILIHWSATFEIMFGTSYHTNDLKLMDFLRRLARVGVLYCSVMGGRQRSNSFRYLSFLPVSWF